MLLGLQEMSSVSAPAGLSCQPAITSRTRGFHAMQPTRSPTHPIAQRRLLHLCPTCSPREGAEPHGPSTGEASTSQPWRFSLPSLVRRVRFQPLYSAINRMAVIPTVGHDPRVLG